MTRLRLLDLFCGAGGAAMGYHQAGFDVVGVDLAPQPRYPFDFVRADALDVLSSMVNYPTASGKMWRPGYFDAVHASPPCQHYAPVTRWRGSRDDHPDLLLDVIDRLSATDLPWVVENVPGAPMYPDFVLCGSQFGLPFRRHRWFTVFPMVAMWALVPPCQHSRDDYSFDHGRKQPESVYRNTMGCGWMTVDESREAIPPAYTEFMGRQLLSVIEGAAA